MKRKQPMKPDPALSRVWLRPEIGWLTFDQAPFHFFPEYVGPGVEFEREIRREVETGWAHETDAKKERLDVTSLGPATLQIVHSNVELILNSGLGTVQVVDIDGWPVVAEAPIDVALDALGQSQRDYPEIAHAIAAIHRTLSALWSSHRRYFATALTDGHAVVVGRVSAISSPFTVIEPDQWRYFDRSDDSARPSARSQLTDEVIFSPMVMPIPKSISAEDKVVHEATEWLISHMVATQEAPMTRKEAQKIVCAQWRSLSGRVFLQKIWPDAKNAIPNNTYGLPGAPKKPNRIALVKP